MRAYPRESRRTGRLALAAFSIVAAATASMAQTLSAPGLSNSSSGSECYPGNCCDTSYARDSSLATQSSSSSQFATRYASVASADAGGFGGSRSETMSTDYTLSFSVTAPGAYFVDVATRLKGELDTFYDGGLTGGSADISAVTGAQNGGTVLSGSLSLADPGSCSVSGANSCALPFDQVGTVRIFGTSNGTAKNHSLQFTWTSNASTAAASGHESAARLGIGGCDASNGNNAAPYPGNNNRDINLDGHFVTATLTSLCGNGVIDAPAGSGYAEECDQGAANGTSTSCCSTSCTFKSNGTQCRPSTDECDPQEVCTGALATCPGDVVSPSGTPCTSDSNPCTLDQCDGSSGACQHPAGNAGTACRASSDGGVCDPGEVCDGASTSCPADAFFNTSTPCPDTTPSDCFAARCNGAGSCNQTQTFETDSYICRGPAGVCDQAEACSGASGTCPADQFLANVTCREAAPECDVAELCTGSSAHCPDDGFQAVGTACADSNTSDCFDAQCNGSGACNQTQAFEAASFVCRASTDGGVCDLQESCTGSSGTCPVDAFTAAGTTCTDTNTADCFEAQCNGSGSCDQTQGLEANGYVCRPSTGECDPQEQCDGTTGVCPNDASTPQGTPCTDMNTNDCFDAQCNGSGACHQSQAVELSGYICRAATDICDEAETCNGVVGACPENAFKPNTVECRAATDPDCDLAETCSGAGASCPADAHVSNGTACNDHNGCTTVDSCQAGTCIGGSPPQDCGDGVLCTDDVCVSTGDATHTCTHPVSNNRCLIDAACQNANQRKSGNDCQQCDPGSSQTAWSNVAQGGSCATGFGLCNGAGTCEEPLALCGAAPLPPEQCKGPAPGRAKLTIRNFPVDTKDGISFSLGKGDATIFSDFGDPVHTTHYALCLYDGNGTPKLQLRIRPGEACKAGIPCWKNVSAKKYAFKDKRDASLLGHNGITKMLLQPGVQAKTKVSLKGKGVNLEPPLLPLSKPITVQLINGRGGCWGATFSTAGTKKDAGFAFVGVSD